MSRTLTLLVCASPHTGTRTQALGIAEAFARHLRASNASVIPHIRLHTWRDEVSARVPIPGRPGPDVIVSCSPAGERKARRQIRRRPDLLWVHVERMKQPGRFPDLHVVPMHDIAPELEGQPGVLRIRGVPHRVTPAALEERRPAARAAFGVPDGGRVAAVLIGGPNPAFDFSADVARRIADTVERLAEDGFRVFVTASRRTPPEVPARLAAIRHSHVTLWDGRGENPYRDYLAMADALFVTEDSVTMSCEALASGRPTFRLDLTPRPGPRLEKFHRFQAAWSDELRPFAAFTGETAGAPPVPDETDLIARRMLDALSPAVTSAR